MPSLQCRILRLVLAVRRSLLDWDAPVERFGAAMDRSERFFKLPRDVAVERVDADGVPAEWLAPPGASPSSVLLYLHGGGWTLGWTNIHRRMVAQLARSAGIRALAPEYRLAPEFPFPAGLDDCLTAYRWLLKGGTRPSEIVIAGDSAGGNLTLATLISLRDRGESLPAAAVCISPMTDLEGTGESFHTKRDLALKPEFALAMARHYAGSHDLRSPLVSPCHADLRGLPPLLIHVGSDEVLLSDAERLARDARAAGVEAQLVIAPGMWHVWHLLAPGLPEARQAVEGIGAFIRERLAPVRP